VDENSLRGDCQLNLLVFIDRGPIGGQDPPSLLRPCLARAALWLAVAGVVVNYFTGPANMTHLPLVTVPGAVQPLRITHSFLVSIAA